MNKDEKIETENVIKALNNVIGRDEAHFENKITLISSGSITLLMTFVANIKDHIIWRELYVIGVIFLSLSLIYNLSMYLYDKYLFRKLIHYLADGLSKNEYRLAVHKNNMIIRRIDILNLINLIFLILGLIMSIIFVCKNIQS